LKVINAETALSHSVQAVANILTNYGVDHLPTLMAAILHDTVEDTDTTLQEIASLFGDDVASIVEVSRTDPRITNHLIHV
jgi:(p)ppGpp synthase/HD superfamily hydrolase